MHTYDRFNSRMAHAPARTFLSLSSQSAYGLAFCAGEASRVILNLEEAVCPACTSDNFPMSSA